MFEIAAAETDSRAAVAQQLAATLAHVVIGRVIPLVVLEGRAWDTGLENLWVHVDSEGAIDWVGRRRSDAAGAARRPVLRRPHRRQGRALRPRRNRAPAQ